MNELTIKLAISSLKAKGINPDVYDVLREMKLKPVDVLDYSEIENQLSK